MMKRLCIILVSIFLIFLPSITLALSNDELSLLEGVGGVIGMEITEPILQHLPGFNIFFESEEGGWNFPLRVLFGAPVGVYTVRSFLGYDGSFLKTLKGSFLGGGIFWLVSGIIWYTPILNDLIYVEGGPLRPILYVAAYLTPIIGAIAGVNSQ